MNLSNKEWLVLLKKSVTLPAINK